MKDYHPIFDALFERYKELAPCAADIALAGELLEKGIREGKKILLCGNGGSAADADHITGELGKSFCRQRPIEAALGEKLRALDSEKGEILARSLQAGIPALNLTSLIALSTAFGNDVDPYLVFAQQTLVYGTEGDILWGISTSGNAKNIYYAALVAQAKGMRVLGMTGKDGGILKQRCDVCIKVPKTKTYEVQELHLPVYHALCRYLEECFW
ncbi:MAG: SIS domain-containing protein [Spirochaetaceae bacterium]|nr:SIS domain-containing protein [Spirochaetaceae bacterium]